MIKGGTIAEGPETKVRLKSFVLIELDSMTLKQEKI